MAVAPQRIDGHATEHVAPENSAVDMLFAPLRAPVRVTVAVTVGCVWPCMWRLVWRCGLGYRWGVCVQVGMAGTVELPPPPPPPPSPPPVPPPPVPPPRLVVAVETTVLVWCHGQGRGWCLRSASAAHRGGRDWWRVVRRYQHDITINTTITATVRLSPSVLPMYVSAFPGLVNGTTESHSYVQVCSEPLGFTVVFDWYLGRQAVIKPQR